jgi:hypothetical protein
LPAEIAPAQSEAAYDSSFAFLAGDSQLRVPGIANLLGFQPWSFSSLLNAWGRADDLSAHNAAPDTTVPCSVSAFDVGAAEDVKPADAVWDAQLNFREQV